MADQTPPPIPNFSWNTVQDLRSVTHTNTVVFANGKGQRVITIDLDKMTVTVSPDFKEDDAAKLFWNRVAAAVGKPNIFPTQ